MNKKTEGKKKGIFETLYAVDVTSFLEQKGNLNLNYLKWASAFRLLLRYYPQATWRVLGHEELDYAIDPAIVAGYIVGTEVTVTDGDESVTRVETLPVMDYNNKVIMKPTAFDINTCIKRCYVKTIAHHGLGLRVFENEPHVNDKPGAEAKGADGNLGSEEPSAPPSVTSVALQAAADELGDQGIPAIGRPKAKGKTLTPVEQKLFIKHVRDNGVAQTDAVKLLKKHNYAKTADIPQARLGFFKSEITRLGQEASTND